MKTLTVDDKTFTWFKNALWFSIGALYDDPYGCCDYPFGDEPEDKYPAPAQQIREEYTFLKELAQTLESSFEKIVEEIASDYEKDRISKILEDNNGRK